MTKYKSYEAAKTRHANTAKVKVGNVIIGELAGLQFRESGGTDGSYTVGTAKPFEHLHNRWTGSGSISRFVWRESAFERFNVGRVGLLDLPPIDIEAMDEIDNAVLFTLIGCTMSDRSMNIQANQRIMSDLSFLALDVQEYGQAANGTYQSADAGSASNGDTPNLADQPALAGIPTGGIVPI